MTDPGNKYPCLVCVEARMAKSAPLPPEKPVGSIMPDPNPERRSGFMIHGDLATAKCAACKEPQCGPLCEEWRKSNPSPLIDHPSPLRLDLGCGPNKKEGWFGVDSRSFPGVDLVFNLVSITDLDTRVDPRGSWYKPWPFADDSVEEAQANHFVEHLTAPERIHFVNELYRVLKPGAKALIVTPHWASCRAYGDLTHQWPPVSEFWFPYLSAAWRAKEAPHNDGYTCDFTSTYGYGINPKLGVRSQEFQQWALEFYKESAMDLVATLVKPAKKVAP